MISNKRLAGLVLLVIVVCVALPVQPANAWSPFTHNTASDTVWAHVIDGSIEIHGRQYPVRPEVVVALQRWPAFYNAGVVGPDRFPNIIYGQAVIHPSGTGRWLRYIYQAAWNAQSSPDYSPDEKQQILVFTYGYVMHAAGDMWAHLGTAWMDALIARAAPARPSLDHRRADGVQTDLRMQW